MGETYSSAFQLQRSRLAQWKLPSNKDGNLTGSEFSRAPGSTAKPATGNSSRNLNLFLGQADGTWSRSNSDAGWPDSGSISDDSKEWPNTTQVSNQAFTDLVPGKPWKHTSAFQSQQSRLTQRKLPSDKDGDLTGSEFSRAPGSTAKPATGNSSRNLNLFLGQADGTWSHSNSERWWPDSGSISDDSKEWPNTTQVSNQAFTDLVPGKPWKHTSAFQSQQSRLTQRKLPSDKDGDLTGSEFSRAPGSTAKPATGNSSPNLNPLLVQADGTWSRSNSEAGWPDSGSISDDSKEWPNTTQVSNQAFTDLVPGKPWKTARPQQANQPLAHQYRMLERQIQMALQAGYLNNQILNQPLAHQTLILLNQLLQHIKVLHNLMQQQQMLQLQNPLAKPNSNQALLRKAAQIFKTKQQITNLQDEIEEHQAIYMKQHNQMPPEGGASCKPVPQLKDEIEEHQAIYVKQHNQMPLQGGAGEFFKSNAQDPPSTFSDLSINKEPQYSSAFAQWKRPSNKDGNLTGSEFSRAPGSTAKPATGNSSRNLNLFLGQADGTWSHSNSERGWPDSGSISDDSKKWPNTTQAFHQAFIDQVQEFEPGKPWKSWRPQQANQPAGDPISKAYKSAVMLKVKQIRMAVQAGYLNDEMLKEPLAPQTPKLMGQLLKHIEVYQNLEQQQEMYPPANRKEFLARMRNAVEITKIMEKISNLQDEIKEHQAIYMKQHNQMPLQGGAGEFFKSNAQDPLSALPSTFVWAQ